MWLQAAVPDGANSYESFVTGGTVLDPACPQIIADFWDEAEAVRACATPSDCGQILTGTSCGCTRNWVANLSADTTDFYDLLSDAGACGLALISTCDCPQTFGFDCVNQQCTWDYGTP